MITETLFDQPKTKANTEDRILEHLMYGGSLTTLECQRLFHTSELRHYISEIRKRGYDVIGEWVKVKAGDHETSVKRFSLRSE